MEMIKAGIQNEIAKLLSLKKYQALLLLTCLISISSGLLGGVTKGLISLSSTNMPFAVLSLVTGFMLPLIIAMAAADLFTAEQENGSIKAVITRPIGRISIFTSKILAIVIYTILILLVCFIISLAWNIVFNGIDLNITETFLAYAVSIVPMLPIILFAVTISQLCKSSSSTVMLTVLGYMIIILMGTILPRVYPMLFTSYTGWYKLFIGSAMPITSILNTLALLVAYTLILFAVSSWAFEKKDY